MVDDFGVKYTSKKYESPHHNALKQYYCITIDWTGKILIEIDLTWNYDEHMCEISMKGYVKKISKVSNSPSCASYTLHQNMK